MSKKLLIIIILLAIIAVLAINLFNFSNQDFDGKFTMNVPLGKHYSDVAWCLPNGALGCKGEYRPNNDDWDFSKGDIVVYYYNNSLLIEGESNALQHALNGLTTSYLYQLSQNDDLIVLTNDIGMSNMPPFLVGKSNYDGSEVVFVGGDNPDDLKHYANTIKFSSDNFNNVKN